MYSPLSVWIVIRHLFSNWYYKIVEFYNVLYSIKCYNLRLPKQWALYLKLPQKQAGWH